MNPFGFAIGVPQGVTSRKPAQVMRRGPQDMPSAPFGFASPPSKMEQTLAILNEYNPLPMFGALMNADPYTLMTDTGPAAQKAVESSFNVGGTVAGASSVVPKPQNALNMGIRAFHSSPNDFEEFIPSKFRGASFFSPTETGALKGASAARNEMAMGTATDGSPVNWRTYEVDIDPAKIKGLSLTPQESEWFASLPQKIVGDENLDEAMKGNPSQLYWDDIYEPKQLSETLFEYTKKNEPPSLSYEDAVKTGRDVYHQQWPHYNNGATDEKAAARNTASDGMGGYLVQDEGGLSIAVVDPKIISIVKKYGIAGASAMLGYNLLDGMDPAQAEELKRIEGNQ